MGWKTLTFGAAGVLSWLFQQPEIDAGVIVQAVTAFGGIWGARDAIRKSGPSRL